MPEQLSHDPIVAALEELDGRLADQGREIWLGAEPTFTDRFSMAPEWQNEALGEEKQIRARRLAAALAAALEGCAFMRTLGRRYPGEALRRWSYGLLSRRDGSALWRGPPDPLLGGGPTDAAGVEPLAAGILDAMSALGWRGLGCSGTTPGEHRILFAADGRDLSAVPRDDPRLRRPSAHAPLPKGEDAPDSLAAEGKHLLILSLLEEDGELYAAAELPALAEASLLLDLLGLIGRSCAVSGLPGLILRGHPPPAAEQVRWTTLTPDPAVVEINQAPVADLRDLLLENRRLFAAAALQNLSPYRLHYNGQTEDSGGGGQLTIGGPCPERSPFRVAPHLLPSLVRYFNHHPALSYWFAPQYVGAFSQAPRPDEGIPDLFEELAATLERLAGQSQPTPELLWRSLNPFLRDVSGNAHRSELNIEKLWSPFPRPDGIAGVVEFRAFRMAPSPEHLAAAGALLRALVAMLMARPFDRKLVRWGGQLHDRFALPFFMELDLDAVLADLAGAGFGLADALAALLREDPGRRIADTPCGEDRLVISSALEFWPQVGDTMNQPADSRLVDASTARIEVRIEGEAEERLGDWRLAVNGIEMPMRRERASEGAVLVFGVRYRRFFTEYALHPQVQPRLPIRIQAYNAASGVLLDAEYHEWRPDGSAYPGLPADRREAECRRRERLVCREGPSAAPPRFLKPPPGAATGFCFDLRRA